MLGFSGTRAGMTRLQRVMFTQVIQHLNANELHHGAAPGADEQAHKIFRATYPQRFAELYPSWYPAQIQKTAWDVTNHPNKPLIRNKMIVDACDVLVITPKTAQEELRSGTWATYRYAKQQGKRVYKINPDGQVIVDA